MMKPIPGESIRQEVDQLGFAIVPDILTAEAVNVATAAIELALKESSQSAYACGTCSKLYRESRRWFPVIICALNKNLKS